MRMLSIFNVWKDEIVWCNKINVNELNLHELSKSECVFKWELLLCSLVPNISGCYLNWDFVFHGALLYKEHTYLHNVGTSLFSTTAAQLRRFFILVFESWKFSCTLQIYLLKLTCYQEKILKIYLCKIFLLSVIRETHVFLYRCSFQIRQEVSLTAVISFQCFFPLLKISKLVLKFGLIQRTLSICFFLIWGSPSRG